MAEIRKCALHPLVAPRGIVADHPQHQLGDLPRDWRPAGSLPSVGPLAGNEIAIPGKERVRCHQVGDLLEYFSSERFCSRGQASSIVVGQMQSTTLDLVSENAILFQQIVDDGLLVSIDPAGKNSREEMK